MARTLSGESGRLLTCPPQPDQGHREVLGLVGHATNHHLIKATAAVEAYERGLTSRRTFDRILDGEVET
jgi:hypothetical protein